jgi:hypothetical protein
VHRVTKRLLWGLAFLFAFVLIWRRTRIVIWVPVSLWQLILLFLGLAAAVYFVFGVLLGRSDSR